MLMATPETMWLTLKVTVTIACSRPPSAPPTMPTRTPVHGPALEAGPGTEPGAEDHHALEADVDHARPLGPQTAETGEADRHGQLRARWTIWPTEVRSSAPVMSADDRDQREARRR